MTNQYLFRSFRTIIIWILSIVILVLLILYLAERGKYAIEKEKLEKTTMYLYDLEIERPLVKISYLIGVPPYKIVDWGEKEFREELSYLLRILDDGLYIMDPPSLEGVPDNFHNELLPLKNTIFTMRENMRHPDTIDEKAKQEIINLSIGVDSCKVRASNSNWAQIISELKCLNKELLTADIN